MSHKYAQGIVFSELGTLELIILAIAFVHVLALALWVYLTATQKPVGVRDRVDLTKTD